MSVTDGRSNETQAITTAELVAAVGATANGKPVISDAEFIERLQDEAGGAWAPGKTISFSFLTSRPASSVGSDYTGFNVFTQAQEQTARTALQLWADVARLSFTENASAAERQGQITFANSSSISDGVWGFAFTTGTTRPVWVNLDGATDRWRGNTPGAYDLSALLHEIGHTLGLLHPSDYNASDTGTVTYAGDAEFYQDSRMYTILSYFSASEVGGDQGRQYAATPLIYDLLAVQDFYGRNYDTRSGDTVYGFNSTAQRSSLDFSVNRQPVVTIWDGGGRNTLDLSGFTVTSNVDLRPASFSDVAGLIGNLSIAVGTYIADATTGTADDVVRDNALANRIVTGGGDDFIQLASGGDDTVDGGAGNDTVRLFGSSGDYRVITNTDGSLLLKGPAGDVLVSNVENFTFSDHPTQLLTRDQVAALDFNGLLYLASNPDLINAFGGDVAAAVQHWQIYGRNEGRPLDSFDPLAYLAANPDLIRSIGLDFEAATRQYVTSGFKEGRSTGGFDALAYLASDPNRIDKIGLSAVGAELDYVQNGAASGAKITFDGLAYIASYADLRAAFGLDPDAGVRHYLNNGYKEYREIRFDVAGYLASNPDLIMAFGYDLDAAYRHYFYYGVLEDRSYQSFNAYDYAGSNPDLVATLGYDVAALTRHYVTTGFAQGRTASAFDVTAYAEANNVSGDGWQEQATRAFLALNRTNGTPFGTDQTQHILTVGTALDSNFTDINDTDWFEFRGDAYTNYTVTIEFLGQSSSTALAQLLVRGQDNMVVITNFGRYPSLVTSFFLQHAEDVYFQLDAVSALADDYRITVTVDTSRVTGTTGVASSASAAPQAVAAVEDGVGSADLIVATPTLHPYDFLLV